MERSALRAWLYAATQVGCGEAPGAASNRFFYETAYLREMIPLP